MRHPAPQQDKEKEMDFAESLLLKGKLDFLTQSNDEVRSGIRHMLDDPEEPNYDPEDALRLVSAALAAYLAGRDYLEAQLDSEDYQLTLDRELAFEEAYRNAREVSQRILHPRRPIPGFSDEEAEDGEA